MLFFNYNSIFRFLLLHKMPLIGNVFLIPRINRLVCFFSIKNLEDLNDTRVYNYFYFFRFFLGYNAFFWGYNANVGFGKTTYDFSIQLILDKKELYHSFFFIINDIIYFIDNSYLSYNFYKDNHFVFFFSVKDMNIFSEKKTNLGLFNLRNFLNIKIYTSANNLEDAKLLLNVFKLYFIT